MKRNTLLWFAVVCIVAGLLAIGASVFFLNVDLPVSNPSKETTATPQTTVTETTTTATTTAATVMRGETSTTNYTISPTKNPVPASHVIKDVPLIKQFPSYPTGCETISTMMVLRYLGESINTEDFINNHLETADFYRKDGKLYGPDPYDKFVGNPRSQYSLGCFAPVIERALISCLGNTDRVKNTTGLTMDQLCEQFIANDTPALVWVSIYMEQVGLGSVWYSESGEKLQWRTNEHCMVLVGYDETHYYFNDPYSGKQLRYAKSIVKDRHAKFENQSIVITK